MTTELQGIELGRVRKNATEDLVLQATRFQGHDLIDLRAFAKTATGDLTPTKKGLCLRPEVWAEVLPILRAALGGEPIANGGDGDNGRP